MEVMWLTLLDMYHYDKDVLSGIVHYKYKYFDGVNLANYLLSLYSLTDCQYNEPPLFAQMVNNFITVHDVQIKALVDGVGNLANVNMTGLTFERQTDTSGNSAAKTTAENRISGFNSDIYQPDNDSSGQSSGNYADSRKERYAEHEKGSETTAPIKATISLAMTTAYARVAAWLASELLICVW